MELDAVLSPAEIDLLPRRDLHGVTCVVFDVLRATSSIITALAHGTGEVVPVLTVEEALSERSRRPGAVLGGERHGDRIEGFDFGNSPMEYASGNIGTLITTTTNGTVALRACSGAAEVLPGALLNMAALEDCLRATRPERVLLVCAGTFRNVALEDVLAAGRLASAFPKARFSDAAQIALAAYEKHRGNLEAGLSASENGRALATRGRAGDVAWCARLSRFSVLGKMRDGVIRPVRCQGRFSRPFP